MHYLVTIGHEDPETGRVKKTKYVFEGDSVEEVTIVAAKYMAGDTRTSELLGVTHMPIECVISPESNPELYKGK